MLMLTRILSPDEQGFYYTFTSMVSLQIFFELGLTYVVLQFASHEKAQLEWTPQGTLDGDPIAKARLASLLRLGFKCYGLMTVSVIAVILPLGLWFFATHQPSGTSIIWRGPWSCLVLVSATSLFLAPIFAILQGCGLIAELAFLRFVQSVAGTVLFWAALTGGWKLLAMPVMTGVTLLSSIVWLGWKKRAFLRDLLAFDSQNNAVRWRQEIWPLQWKIAVSWMSGYLIFQLFNPVLFAFSGAVEAGKMGLSIAAMGALSSVASAWVDTKIAPFGSLIAKRQWEELDRLFFSALWSSFAVVVAGGVVFWSVVFVLHQNGHPLSQRLLPPFPLALLIAASFFNHIVTAEAIYLRAFKREPFLVLSVATAVVVSLSTYFLGRAFGVNGMMLGYFTISLVLGLGGGTSIFVRKRRLWQHENPQTLAEAEVAPRT